MGVSIRSEHEGQLDFYAKVLCRVDSSLTLDAVIQDRNDGVVHGTLLEFKKSADNLNSAVLQAIRYLSSRRIKGKPVPAHIVVVNLAAETAFLYGSEEYLDHIQKPYFGAASDGDPSFIAGPPRYVLKYGSSDLEASRLVSLLKEDRFTKIDIDENCIVGWAETFYRIVPDATKEAFLGYEQETGPSTHVGEIRNPTVLRDFVNPYRGETNIRFKYLMDELNTRMSKKTLGAFYTPPLYAAKSYELLRKAISRVPAGNDYVIIDRCAGTGNLEAGLTPEELGHCVVSTVEYFEYKVLLERIGDLVRDVIPPIEQPDTFHPATGTVKGADALSRDYVENPILRKYIDDPKCSIILFENPPYMEPQAKETSTKGQFKSTFVAQTMKKAVRGTASNDLGNVFIWSAFEYYLRQPTDSYLVFSPVKYWKAQHLVNKRFLGGFAFNRRWFHANAGCIMAALWSNEDAAEEELSIDAYDLDEKAGKLIDCGKLPVKPIHSLFSKVYYDHRSFPDDEAGILLGLDGAETANKPYITPIWNKNIVGYMIANTSGFENPDLSSSLVSAGLYKGHGFFLREDNYLEKLPMFCASRYISYFREWTERGRVMKSADGHLAFERDVRNGKLRQWLLKCLLFTCMDPQNHMRSFLGTDGRRYRNSLCLDRTNGKTIASRDIEELETNELESQILAQWGLLMKYARESSEYDPSLTYGLFQISKEIDTSFKNDLGETVYNNVEVHSTLGAIKELVKRYYREEIVPTLFAYQFLK